MIGGISILHVEDDRRFAEIVREFLKRADDAITVTTEIDPRRALQRVHEDPAEFDCIVSDYDMPKMDGLELLRAVRGKCPEIPFILFTGKGSEEVASEAISGGVTDYLQKGNGSEKYEVLANRVRNAVECRRAKEEAARTQRFLEKVVDRATDIIAVVAPNDEIVFVSGSVDTVLGYTPAEIKEMGAFDLVHPDDRALVKEHFEARLVDPARPTGITHRALHKDGQYVQLQARAYNLTDDPDIEGMLTYTRPADVDGEN